MKIAMRKNGSSNERELGSNLNLEDSFFLHGVFLETLLPDLEASLDVK